MLNAFLLPDVFNTFPKFTKIGMDRSIRNNKILIKVLTNNEMLIIVGKEAKRETQDVICYYART